MEPRLELLTCLASFFHVPIEIVRFTMVSKLSGRPHRAMNPNITTSIISSTKTTSKAPRSDGSKNNETYQTEQYKSRFEVSQML